MATSHFNLTPPECGDGPAVMCCVHGPDWPFQLRPARCGDFNRVLAIRSHGRDDVSIPPRHARGRADFLISRSRPVYRISILPRIMRGFRPVRPRSRVHIRDISISPRSLRGEMRHSSGTGTLWAVSSFNLAPRKAGIPRFGDGPLGYDTGILQSHPACCGEPHSRPVQAISANI
jgi:hypothetical protein